MSTEEDGRRTFCLYRIFEAYMMDLSQYTGSRKMRDMRIVEFWRQGRGDQLRLVSMVYDPDAPIHEEDIDLDTVVKPSKKPGKKKGWVQDQLI